MTSLKTANSSTTFYSTILSFSEHTFCHLQWAYFAGTNGNGKYRNHFGRIFISFVFIYSSLLRKNSFNLSLFAENLKLNQCETRAIIVGDILNMNYSMQELMILRHSKTLKQKNHNL